jgi:hypothetical protein
VLKQLGETFRRQDPKASFMSELQQIKKLVDGKSNADIKRMGIMQEKKKLAAMQILKILLLNAIMVRPKFAPFIQLKAMEITMKYGLSPLSSLAFAGYDCASEQVWMILSYECLTLFSCLIGLSGMGHFVRLEGNLMKLIDLRSCRLSCFSYLAQKSTFHEFTRVFTVCHCYSDEDLSVHNNVSVTNV